MSTRTGTQEVRNPIDAQRVPEFPIESWYDSLTGRRWRRQFLGSCNGGILLVGDIVFSSGVDLYYKRVQGNPNKPKPSRHRGPRAGPEVQQLQIRQK